MKKRFKKGTPVFLWDHDLKIHKFLGHFERWDHRKKRITVRLQNSEWETEEYVPQNCLKTIDEIPRAELEARFKPQPKRDWVHPSCPSV